MEVRVQLSRELAPRLQSCAATAVLFELRLDRDVGSVVGRMTHWICDTMSFRIREESGAGIDPLATWRWWKNWQAGSLSNKIATEIIA